MGSTNAYNPVHLDNGQNYRHMAKRLQSTIAIAKQNGHLAQARQYHDLLLAQLAVINSVFLSNSGNGTMLSDRNLTARDYAPMAYSKQRFYKYFDAQMEAYK